MWSTKRFVARVGDGPELRVEGIGSRTHRKRVRILTTAKFPGHVWAGAVFPSGRAFYVQQHAGEDGPIISEECWVKAGDVFHRAELIDPPRFRPALAGERFEKTAPNFMERSLPISAIPSWS